jgi:hypothetical protein
LIEKIALPKQTADKLCEVLGTDRYSFLGFTVDLKTSAVTDNISNEKLSPFLLYSIFTLLQHYAEAKPSLAAGRLVKFKDLPGGCAYENAFIKRAIEPIAAAFGDDAELLKKAAERLGGVAQKLGDASIKIEALNNIPLTYILYSSDEFGASANILYDASASNYLPTEDLAVLGEITTLRLIQATKENELSGNGGKPS